MSRFQNVPIKYVGLKDEWYDHLYGSGVTFKRDKVKAVPPHYAVSLLKHPEFVDARPEGEAGTKIQYDPNRQNEHLNEEVEKEDLPPLVDINMLDKTQLTQYAKRYFNQDLPPKARKDEMIDKVRSMMGQRGRGG